VGIYGLGIELNGLVSPQNFGKTRYLDPLETALQMEKMLKQEQKCDLVIALSHLGLSYEHDKISDKSLAAQTHYTDLIVGGHTHSFLDKPLLLKNAPGEQILVNQAGTAALLAGKIEFVFSRSGKKQAHSSVVYKL
jgi:5'-nucleotidase